jgi:ATP-dependent Clp protease protease subunit
MTNQVPSEIYVTLSGVVDVQMVQRIFQGCAVAVNNRVRIMHLLIQSAGGNIAEGIAIYNYFRHLPIRLITYNAGTISSIAVIVFLAGTERKASESANFMIHRSHISPNPSSPAYQLQNLTDGLVADDQRTEKIYRSYITMPDEKWKMHEYVNLIISANEAVQFGLIHEISDFKPPEGANLSNI